MKLSEYNKSECIFIDANIFLDYSLPNPKYGESAADFLEKIELNEIKAVTTPIVLDEVSFIILMYKGSLLLKTQDRKMIIKTIKKDTTLSSLCYEMIDEFNEFITCLKGLVILSVDYEEYKHASELGKKYLLLPSDALHASTMETNKIHNIATRDGDFKRIEGITVWKPRNHWNPCLWDVFYTRIYTNSHRFFSHNVCRQAPSVPDNPPCAIFIKI